MRKNIIKNDTIFNHSVNSPLQECLFDSLRGQQNGTIKNS